VEEVPVVESEAIVDVKRGLTTQLRVASACNALQCVKRPLFRLLISLRA
jgi:hypothetical protein